MNWEEACTILGVKETASSEEIREQYLYKAQILHPDKTIGKPESIRKKAEEEFKLINQAYEFLKSPSNNPFNNPPKLKVEPPRIRFKDVEIGQKKSTTFQINNVGGAYTNIWIDNEPASWLLVTAAKSTSAEQLPLNVMTCPPETIPDIIS
jgi:curved DNA-binding protein CbpA